MLKKVPVDGFVNFNLSKYMLKAVPMPVNKPTFEEKKSVFFKKIRKSATTTQTTPPKTQDIINFFPDGNRDFASLNILFLPRFVHFVKNFAEARLFVDFLTCRFTNFCFIQYLKKHSFR